MTPAKKQALFTTHQALEIIGSKWVLTILYNLCSSPKGFNELLRNVEGVSPRILSLRMKELVEYGLISKTVFPTTPPQVEYKLTPKGQSLKSILESLNQWAQQV